jgi:hypothetical protein
MNHGKVVKKIFTSKSEGRRRMERPRLRWMEYVKKYLWEIQVKRWRRKAVNRAECTSVSKETKAVRGR